MSTTTTSIFLSVSPDKPRDIALILKTPQTTNSYSTKPDSSSSTSIIATNEITITNSDLLKAKNRGKVNINNSPYLFQVYPSSYSKEYSSSLSSSGSTTTSLSLSSSKKTSFTSYFSLVLPTTTLLSAILGYFLCDANGWDAIFPSKFTSHIVFKLTVWGTLISIVAREQAHFWYGSGSSIGNNLDEIELEVVLYHDGNNNTDTIATKRVSSDATIQISNVSSKDPASGSRSSSGVGEQKRNTATVNATSTNVEATLLKPNVKNTTSTVSTASTSTSSSTSSSSSRATTRATTKLSVSTNKSTDKTPSSTSLSSSTTPKTLTSIQPSKSVDPPDTTKTTKTIITPSSPDKSPKSMRKEQTIPFRFIRATKGDITAARARWADTCSWRKEWGMDEVLHKPHPHVELIKRYYPHHFHLRGKKNECCYYERPPKMNLTELKKEGLQIEDLLKHYAICCEFMWTEIEDSEEGKSIYVIDLDGIGIRDFAGEVVDFVKRASSFTGAHYPERSGSIYVINVPSWFSVIWNVVKPMVDDVTKKKISIMRYGKEAITKALMEKIDIENIPPEYGGKSMPLGQSPEEIKFMEHFAKLNNGSN